MKKINLKNVIEGLQTSKNKTYNTDLFFADAENITNDFSKSNYNYLELLTTDHDQKSGLPRETILAIGTEGDSYLISTHPQIFNGEVSISIFSKWMTLQGFNYFSKNSSLFLDGEIQMEAVEFYDNYLQEQGLDITYQDIKELAIFNPEFDCSILSFQTEEEAIHITINNKNQLSRITRKILATPPKVANIVKSILN